MGEDNTIRARWTGETFEPVGNFARAWCMDNLDEGETVALDVSKDRSMKSHRHQFAEIKTLWETLPESLHNMPYAQSAETLRKHALIATGYCDVETIDAGSKAAAERVGAFVSGLARRAHGYAVVTIKGPMVKCYTPHSQSVRAMGGPEFQVSKDKVLDWISARIGAQV